LHGFPDHAPSFQPLLLHLAASGNAIWAPWMRGYAPSMLEGPFDADQLARDVLALCDHISPERPVTLVGHDWGAVACYAATEQAPARFRCAITLAVPHPLAFLHSLRTQGAQRRRSWYMVFFQLPWLPERTVRRAQGAFIERLWAAWSPGLSPDPAAMRELKDCLARSLPGPIEYYRAMTRPLGAAAARLRRTGRRIEVPTLHLQGADDGCIAPAACKGQERFFAGPFEHRTLAGAGHFVQLERPSEVAEAALGWMARHP
jgi:pimeloyl-ACP methyl ester carboxylesterase